MFRGEVERGIGADPREDACDGGIALEDARGTGLGKVMELAIGEAGLEMLERGAAVKDIANVIVAKDEGLAPCARVGGGAGFQPSPGAEKRGKGLDGDGNEPKFLFPEGSGAWEGHGAKDSEERAVRAE